MNHFPSSDLISAYVDDRLSPQERAEVEALLQSSDEARAEFESYRQLRTALKALPTEQAAPDLLSRIMAQAEQESLHGKPVPAEVSTRDRQRSFWKRWTIPTASVAACLAFLLLVMVQNRPPRVVTDSPMSSEAASSVDNQLFDEVNTVTELDRTALDDASAMPGGGASTFEHKLGTMERIELVRDGDTDGTVNMLSGYDIKNAEVGEVVDVLQMQDDRVVVVHLTVIDRQQVLDRMHVLLSKMEVPRESPGSNSYGTRQSDLLSLYVEMDEGRLETLLSDINQNAGVEEMFVSTAIPSAALNAFAREQGYGDIDSEQDFAKLKSNVRMSVPPQPALKDTIPPENTEAAAEGRPKAEAGRQDPNAKEVADFQNQSESNRRRFTPSGYPPPPPLPQDPVRSQTMDAEPAPALPQPAEALADRKNTFEYRNQQRHLLLRLTESFGNQLLQQPPQADGQLSTSNGEAAGREIEKEALGKSGNQKKEVLSLRSAPSNKKQIAVDDKPAPPEPAPPKEENTTELAAEAQSRPGAAKLNQRSYRILFVLTDDPARPLEAAPPSPADAAEKPRD